VLRRAAAGPVWLEAVASTTSSDIDPSNNAAARGEVFAATLAAGIPVQRYRLYSPVTLEHHFTTAENEYNVLGTFAGTWFQEGAAGKVLNNPGSFNGVQAVPYYRLYCDTVRWHHWTTDPNEYYTLMDLPCWHAEGVDGYILPSPAAGTMELYRLVLLGGTGLHHWTVDPNEVAVLTNGRGWMLESGGGYVIQ